MTVHLENSLSNAASILAEMQFETLRIEAVELPNHIPKKLSDKAVQALMRAIGRTGQQIMPILVDDQSRIVSGFDVFAAMRELGAKEVGVVRLANLTRAETNAVMLLLAKIPEISDWDTHSVANILQEILIEDPDAIDITGFEVPEIDIVLGSLGETTDANSSPTAAEDDKDSFAELGSSETPVVEPGDVFCLNDHRIICGNSLTSRRESPSRMPSSRASTSGSGTNC